MTFTKIISISDIRKNIKDIPKVGGVYKHYVDKQGLEYLDSVHPTTTEIAADGTEVYLLYIGLSSDLFKRFKWHLGIINKSHSSIIHGTLSTLRLSYMANHKKINCLSEQEKLDNFMDEHTYAQYMITEDFDKIEKQLIKENDLPLNVQRNSHIFVQTNSSRRVAISKKYKNEHTDDTPTHKKKVGGRIEEDKLIKYAKEAKKEGIQNKSQFIKWFRKDKNKKASQDRLHHAWIEQNS